MIKLKYSNLSQDAVDAAAVLARQQMPPKASVKAAAIIRETRRAFDQMMADLRVMAEKCGTNDAGQLLWDGDTAQAFLDQDVELACDGLTLDELKNATIAPALAWCIIDPVAESGEG